MSLQSSLTKAATNEVARLVKGVQPAVRTAEKEVVGKLGREILAVSTEKVAQRQVQRSAEREALEVGLKKFGLVYDDATAEWLAARRAKGLLDVLGGIKLEAKGFRQLAEAAADKPVEVARVKSIADFIRKRPWMNPDLATVESFRAALPQGRNPVAAELEAAIHKVDFRFKRDYKLATDWVDDAHAWEYVQSNGVPGDEGVSYWLKNAAGEFHLAKVPPEARRGVNERVGYGIHTALDVPVNQVQYGQRDFVPLLTVHKRVEGNPVGLNRVADDIGLDATDFRVGAWPYPAENIGTGPSTWNRANAEAYQAKIGSKLEDPTIFDRLAFIGRINDDGDLKPGNILASAIRKNRAGEDVYRITRIDFGIMHDGWRLRNLQDDLGIFERYLTSLEAPTNTTHLRNILSTMKQFASLSDDNLTREMLGNIWRNSDNSPALHMPPEFQYQMTRRFLVKRDMVRDWLQKNAELVAKLGG